MDSKRIEEIISSTDVIRVSYNGIPVWIESINGDEVEVSLIGIGMDRKIHLPSSALAETGPMQTL